MWKAESTAPCVQMGLVQLAAGYYSDMESVRRCTVVHSRSFLRRVDVMQFVSCRAVDCYRPAHLQVYSVRVFCRLALVEIT